MHGSLLCEEPKRCQERSTVRDEASWMRMAKCVDFTGERKRPNPAAGAKTAKPSDNEVPRHVPRDTFPFA